ncbi:AAA family ATPase [Fluviicola sp.]|uniref:ATP-dependent nuclease n=1 Tax=Fluviicola sp. TaxID=1917219 RepID=UPI0031DAB78E
MRYTYFSFKNFKGIESARIELSKKSNSNIYTLVGLNESGKTTILEAINFFAHNPEKLDALDLQNYSIDDIHDLIPINKRDNFNDEITIEAEVVMEDSDIEGLKRIYKENDLNLVSFEKNIIFTQSYVFKNSIHDQNESQMLWRPNFYGTEGKKKKVQKFDKTQTDLVVKYILECLPSILYFPNFLFEFPEKVYLNSTINDKKHLFYQKIIQDVLDSLENDTDVSEHLVKRIQSTDDKERRNLDSLIGKMQKKLTEVIFTKWNQIFNKEISKTEIILRASKDEKGPFIEFNIKDDVDTYRINERSLGFRWYFVYILLTQFRSYRKKNNQVLFLFDEPASNLHPSAQSELLNSFEKLHNVIYTTHSHYLINPKWLENTFVIKNDAIDYLDESNYVSKNTKIHVKKYREFAVKHPNQHSYFQPILEVLDYKPSNLDLVPDAVFTEGKNDFYTLNYLQNIYFKTKKPISVIPGTSSSNLDTLISLYLGWGRNFIILLDSDKEGRKQRDRYIEAFGESISKRIHTYDMIDPTWKDYTLEKFFKEDEKHTIQQRNYPSSHKFNKKHFNRSIQELNLKMEKISLSKETETDLIKVFKYLSERLK